VKKIFFVCTFRKPYRESTLCVYLLRFNINNWKFIWSAKLFSTSCVVVFSCFISKNILWGAYPFYTLANGEFLPHLNVILKEIGRFNAKWFSDIRSGSNNASFGARRLLNTVQYSSRKKDVDTKYSKYDYNL